MPRAVRPHPSPRQRPCPARNVVARLQPVSLALAVSEAAMKAAACQPGDLLAVFTSAHGDLPAIDQLCDTLARTPLMVSPTRFLHTIHNAPLGVWSMLHGNGRNHTAVSAAECSFAAGLLEAAVLVETEQQPVLLVGYDTAATGALVHTTRSQGAMAVALVLSPRPSHRTLAQVGWRLEQAASEASEPQTAAGRSLPTNGMSQALPAVRGLGRRAGRDAVDAPFKLPRFTYRPATCDTRHTRLSTRKPRRLTTAAQTAILGGCKTLSVPTMWWCSAVVWLV